MYCQNCGKQIPDGSLFCTECGSAVTPYNDQDTGAETANQAQPEQTGYRAPEYHEPVYQQSAYSQPGPEAAQSEPVLRPDGFAIAALCLAVASVLACCFVFLQVPLAIAGLVFGILGLKTRLKTMAIVSIVISSISLVFGIIILIMSISLANSPEFRYGIRNPEEFEDYINNIFNNY